jgi:SpoIID/LytB domain protein
MRRRISQGLSATAAILVLALATCTSPGPEDRSETTFEPSAGSPSPSPDEAAAGEGDEEVGGGDGGDVRLPIRVAPPHDGTLLVLGSYPPVGSRCRDPEQPTLTGRFPGTLLVQDGDDGTLSLTVALPFDRYLEGIAEVPPTWPAAALEAQAIAARSYALATTGWDGKEGETLDRPICATASCQVYRGIPVPPEPAHRRWVRAVHRTDGQALLHEGRPATTVYFSTSNGRTYGNDEVFGSPPLPYLRPVTERDDGASSTSRWRVRVPFTDLARSLRAAGAWPRGRAISGARLRGDSVVLRGGGSSRSIDLDELRDILNVWAPCLSPDRYPPRTPDGELPLTVPSRWLRASASRQALVLAGRGWGHGVGMVQWGAYGKARRGETAADILAFYYGGLRPEHYPEPGLIRVQVAAGLRAIRIVASDVGAKLDGRVLEADRRVVVRGERVEVKA